MLTSRRWRCCSGTTRICWRSSPTSCQMPRRLPRSASHFSTYHCVATTVITWVGHVSLVHSVAALHIANVERDAPHAHHLLGMVPVMGLTPGLVWAECATAISSKSACAARTGAQADAARADGPRRHGAGDEHHAQHAQAQDGAALGRPLLW